MRFDELEKRVNELIKERGLDEKFQRYESSFDEIENLIEEVLGKKLSEFGRIYFDHYGTKGKLVIKHWETGCAGIEIYIRRKKGEEKRGGYFYFYTEYAIKNIEIVSLWKSLDGFVTDQENYNANRKIQEKNDYESLVAELKEYGLDEKKFLDDIRMRNGNLTVICGRCDVNEAEEL